MLREGPEISMSESHSACLRATIRSVDMFSASFQANSKLMREALGDKISDCDREETRLRISKTLLDALHFLSYFLINLIGTLFQGIQITFVLLALILGKASELQ